MNTRFPLIMIQLMAGYRAAGLSAEVIANQKSVSLRTFNFARTVVKS